MRHKHLLQWGSEYWIADKSYACCECGRPTRLIDIIIQMPVCSAECAEKIDVEMEKCFEDYKEKKKFYEETGF